MSPRKPQQGFTLIEIAVVLVIVGLLIGGIMKGQEMISSAKVKNLGQDLRNIGSYAYAYQDKFRALPGDDKAVATHVTSGTLATTNGTPGNGRIEGEWNSATATDESNLFWQHIRLANIVSGPTDPAAADYLPRNAFGGNLGVTGTAPIAGWNGNLFACASGVTGAAARQLDTMLDDGNTIAGSLRVVAENVVATGTGVTLTPSDDGKQYTVCLAL